jgi:hypothetical protein
MQKQGGFMGGEMLFLMAAMLVAMYGVYKYISAETNDYLKLVETVKILQGDINSMELKIGTQDKRLDNLAESIGRFKKIAEEASEDVDNAQVHLAKMQKSQIDLSNRNRALPSTVELVLSTNKPIPIEIISKAPRVKKARRVTRTVTQKTKTGTVQRSETRTSPLIGDPNFKPLKKRTKKKTIKKRPTKKRATKKKVVSKKKSKSNGGYELVPRPLPGLIESVKALAMLERK